MRRLQPIVLAAIAGLGGGVVSAQNPAAAAAYAELRLSGGFVPDPRTVSLTAGGSISPSITGCSYGRVANAPDVKLHYSEGGGRTLYIYATSSADVTLLINMPDGSWRCDDDSYTGNNPLVVIPNAPSGRYDIWVGTYGSSTAPAQLMISEINPGGDTGGGPPSGGGSGGIDPSLPATYATVNLRGGFTPDPNVTSLTAGGSQRVNLPGCSYGQVASAPDVKLNYSMGGGRTLYIYATSDVDVTLLINMPDGNWRCDDDSYGNRNPLIVIPNAPSGRYDIWVGTYGSSMAPARLMISEISPR
jgi:hypothetical protein